MTKALAESGLSNRLSSAFLEEERRGIAWSMRARLIALAVIAVWLIVDNLDTGVIYTLGLLAGFAAIGIAFLQLSRSESYATWMKYVFIALDAALLTFTLLAPNPLSELSYDIQIQFRFDNFTYFYVILVGIAAFTYSPRFVVWSGIVCAAAWGIGASLIIFRADTLTLSDLPPNAEPAELFAIFLDPKFVFVSGRVNEILATLIVAGILAAAAWRARRLVVAQAEAVQAAVPPGGGPPLGGCAATYLVPYRYRPLISL